VRFLERIDFVGTDWKLETRNWKRQQKKKMLDTTHPLPLKRRRGSG